VFVTAFVTAFNRLRRVGDYDRREVVSTTYGGSGRPVTDVTTSGVYKRDLYTYTRYTYSRVGRRYTRIYLIFGYNGYNGYITRQPLYLVLLTGDLSDGESGYIRVTTVTPPSAWPPSRIVAGYLVWALRLPPHAPPPDAHAPTGSYLAPIPDPAADEAPAGPSGAPRGPFCGLPGPRSPAAAGLRRRSTKLYARGAVSRCGQSATGRRKRRSRNKCFLTGEEIRADKILAR
jgi:hypothetical protein